MITVSEGDYGIASNADADAGDGATGETLDAQSERVIDIVHSHRLMETSFSKSAYVAYIKGYMSKLKAYLEKEHPERVQDFMKEAQAFVKKIISHFDDYSFYIGESGETEAMVPILFYKEDGITPCFYIFKDGVNAETY